MFNFTLRLAKRFAILIPGLVIAYFSVNNIFPLFEKKLPLGVAILFTYILAAYLLIPALIRLIRIVIPTRHLPLYCVTPDGLASDPLNIAIIGSRREIVAAMNAAGWYVAEPHTFYNVAKQIIYTFTGHTYPNAPVSSLYLFGRKQDIAFEIPLKGAWGHRHHVRFWATTYQKGDISSAHSIHWHKRKDQIKTDDDLLWVGAASLDVGITFIRHNIQLTHMIDPDTNRERNLIVKQLRASGLVESVKNVLLDKPYKVINRAWRGSLHTDGKMAVVKLKPRRSYSRRNQ